MQRVLPEIDELVGAVPGNRLCCLNGQCTISGFSVIRP
jgi:hypothetical protein